MAVAVHSRHRAVSVVSGTAPQAVNHKGTLSGSSRTAADLPQSGPPTPSRKGKEKVCTGSDVDARREEEEEEGGGGSTSHHMRDAQAMPNGTKQVHWHFLYPYSPDTGSPAPSVTLHLLPSSSPPVKVLQVQGGARSDARRLGRRRWSCGAARASPAPLSCRTTPHTRLHLCTAPLTAREQRLRLWTSYRRLIYASTSFSTSEKSSADAA